MADIVAYRIKHDIIGSVVWSFDFGPEGRLGAMPLFRPYQISGAQLAGLPKVVFLTKIRGDEKPPEFVANHIGPFLVSSSLRELIERLEPGIHSFFPVEAHDKLSTNLYGKLEIMHVHSAVDCIDFQRTKFRQIEGLAEQAGPDAGSRSGFDPDAGSSLHVRKNIVAGRHFWRATSPAEKIHFISPTAYSALVESGVGGLCVEACF
jgi:hypothetical protein